MADDEVGGATAPGGGRTTQETMHEAAHRRTSGPGSHDALAAGGGLALPGGRAHVRPPGESDPAPIPGERDPSTLTSRQPGAMGGRFSGADTPASDPRHVMGAETIRDRAREGGTPADRLPSD